MLGVVPSSATTPAQYLAELSDDRRPAIERVCEVRLERLPHDGGGPSVRPTGRP